MMDKMKNQMHKRETCRVCNGKRLQMVLGLGATPPANAFLKKEEVNAAGKEEPFFPLEVYFCKDCGFLQLLHIVNPELLFRNYVYVSSTSPVFVAHFKELAEKVCNEFEDYVHPGALIADIGSNDGILLRPFKEKGMKVLGIDPAEKIARLATESGIETLPVFFTGEVAREIAKTRGKAKVIASTSCFSHIDDLDEVVGGVNELLADDGIFIIEVYYLLEMLKKNLFDLVYHEHLSYFSVKTMKALLDRLGLEIFHTEVTDTHGGSLRVFARKKNGPHSIRPSVRLMEQEEEKYGLDKIETYEKFAEKVEHNKKELKKLLAGIKAKEKKIVGYGAPAKGNTLLSYFEIGPEVLDYIVDDSTWKQGLYTPGTHIPVVSSDELYKNKPDYILILAWNFAEHIMKKYSDFQKFIVPVPKPRIVDNLVEQDLNRIAEGIKKETEEVLAGKTVLITGGSGFIGSYIVATIDLLNQRILKQPCRVISVDNHIIGKKNNLIKEIYSEYVTYLDHNVCNPMHIEGNVDYIISAAGVASPVYYKKYPIETIEGTIFGVKNCLELAIQKKAKSVLYFSSSEIYGDPDPNFIPTPENYKGNVSCTGPRSCYDESKRVGETICTAYYRVYNVPVKIVRPFNIFGPGMKGTDYRVIPKLLSNGLSGMPLTVHDKGNQTRTFCYVTDAITGFFKILLNGRDGEAYNVGNDNDEINMLALAETISDEVFEGKAKIERIKYPDNYPQDEPRRRCPDLTKTRKELNYNPDVDLRTGLKRAFLWLKNNEE